VTNYGSTGVVKGQDNLYAGHDGNVYKRDDNGDWSKWDNGQWNPVTRQAGTTEQISRDKAISPAKIRKPIAEMRLAHPPRAN
jgi:hypothetical protein